MHTEMNVEDLNELNYIPNFLKVEKYKSLKLKQSTAIMSMVLKRNTIKLGYVRYTNLIRLF